MGSNTDRTRFTKGRKSTHKAICTTCHGQLKLRGLRGNFAYVGPFTSLADLEPNRAGCSNLMWVLGG